ncbi:hypothetical protein C9374_009800 [Naegleria lovaniensis]|uniref:C2H2-type domain-containing protein n=1 Tax=Naegleria lovaniensis TaxID=51637 RepID=A0AA88H280_NAELO|nr:uncharacterized protein C9374_009800 [Naegleria lovaniensis]KAG2393223.1 hypothetical protein C9374_009800 [Naegleria lovaniensis]
MSKSNRPQQHGRATFCSSQQSSQQNEPSTLPQSSQQLPSGETQQTKSSEQQIIKMSQDELQQLTNKNLKELCKQYHVRTSGNKQQLVQTIMNFYASLNPNASQNEFEGNLRSIKKLKKSTNNNSSAETKETKKRKKSMTSSRLIEKSKKKKKSSIVCEECNKKFASKKALLSHNKDKHGYIPEGWKKAPEFCNPYITKECGKPSNKVTNGNSFELFKQLYTAEVEKHILEKTNLKCAELKKPEVTLQELNYYFAITFTMGLIKMPELAHYWTKEEEYLFGNGLIRNIMTKKRFREIHQCISYDIDWILDTFCNLLHECWIPSNIGVVDECIILFKGRFKGRQHVRGKPHATGLKLFILCDSFGMPVWFWLYRGKNNEHNLSTTVVDYVMDLAKKLPDYNTRKYAIITDQFYGSLTLAEQLKQNNFEFVLSCQSNRPSEIFSNYLQPDLKQKGDQSFIVRNDNAFAALSVFDSGKCNFMASVGSTSIPREELERVKAKRSNKTPRCDILRFYNMNMGSVDSFDAALNLYHFRSRHRSWKRCMFFAMMKTLVVGSHKLYQYFHMGPNNRKPQQLGHLVAIIYSLSDRQPRYKEISTLQHFPMLTQQPKPCEFCKRKGIRSNTTFKCSACAKHAHSHCWFQYHTCGI